MFLNFEVSGIPEVVPVTRIKGGNWRDRSAAKRRLRKTSTPGPQSPTSIHDNSEQPTKRRKLDKWDPNGGDTLPACFDAALMGKVRARSVGINKAKPSTTSGSQVTSRLFSFNPSPKTDFENLEAQPVTSGAVKPSNAPLPEEAAGFHALGLSQRIANHLTAKLELRAPTVIQKKTIPQLVKHDADAFLQAETGSGKTLAYLLPIVQRIIALSQNEDDTNRGHKIQRRSGVFAIILAPTRELCKQIGTVAEKLLQCAPWIVTTAVVGGESRKSEKARIRKGVNILIATPGRLADHLDHTKVLDVSTARWLILDEGDRLMEMGFEKELRSIVAKIRQESLALKNKDGIDMDTLPQRRVTVLCSATMKINVQRLGEISLVDAVHITASRPEIDKEDEPKVNEAVFSAPSQLKQTYVVTPAKLRLVTLIALLKNCFERKGSIMKAIIFMSCADSVDYHFSLLSGPAKSSDGPENVERNNKTGEPSPSHKSDTVSPAAYITSSANPSITVFKLHGSLPQQVRTATLRSFTRSKLPAVLIATDIASRGLDVPAVDLIIEYDPAFALPDHVHRIGRTARAGRPGKAVLFLQPGCEEGYVSLIKSFSSSGATNTNVMPQLYKAILQNGLARPVTNFPVETTATEESSSSSSESSGVKQTWTTRAEKLQLHLEQRLLLPTTTAAAAAVTRQANKTPLIDSARRAFRSHIRAYATHVRDERHFFDITKLHLGHMAKAFALREAPGDIGAGVTRKAGVRHKAFHGAEAAAGVAKGQKKGGGDLPAGGVGEGRRRG